ncbi:cupin domain-containing protein [Cnuibacter physcomitrellae]|uniref:cupin domain-containing protein n=1 Tax=Cnuibacter physcomitrellae TaxID=1619308 RepID=UPI0021756E75|nr:cupin domain-containing protein [Cnuibacter physcomitrellae]MCS5498301.1 cupin domain-containing protein [Cnuibacter physcomitrellae]
MTQYLGNAFELPLESATYEALDDGHEVAAGRTKVGELAGARIGLWEAEPGLIGGVTTDEIFVVLEGHAEVTFEDTKETISMGPGDIVRLNAGQRNSWRTSEKLRKVSVSIPVS